MDGLAHRTVLGRGGKPIGGDRQANRQNMQGDIKVLLLQKLDRFLKPVPSEPLDCRHMYWTSPLIVNSQSIRLLLAHVIRLWFP